MGLDSAKVITRSNSELCNLEIIVNDLSLSTPARMALVLAIACDWHGATQGSTGRHAAEREASKHSPTLWKVTEKRRKIAPATLVQRLPESW